MEPREPNELHAVEPTNGPAVRVRVPSKINLFLAVRGLRDDGYHELVSVMQTVGLVDTLTVELAGTRAWCQHPAARRFMGVELKHDAGPEVPSDEENLAARAARALLGALGLDEPTGPGPDRTPVTRMRIEKRIPVAGGMAGGSADAAAALVALNDLWDAGLERDELRTLAAELGADVPFCVAGGTALATGTGTATAQVLCRGEYHWVVGIADEPLSTPAVYRRWDEIAAPSEVEPDAVLHALRTGDAEALGAALHNDLEVAAFDLRPELRNGRDALLEAGALGAVVSGSGPTLLGLAPDAVTAARIARDVGSRFARVEVAASPAGGPELLQP